MLLFAQNFVVKTEIKCLNSVFRLFGGRIFTYKLVFSGEKYEKK